MELLDHAQKGYFLSYEWNEWFSPDKRPEHAQKIDMLSFWRTEWFSLNEKKFKRQYSSMRIKVIFYHLDYTSNFHQTRNIQMKWLKHAQKGNIVSFVWYEWFSPDEEYSNKMTRACSKPGRISLKKNNCSNDSLEGWKGQIQIQRMQGVYFRRGIIELNDSIMRQTHVNLLLFFNQIKSGILGNQV